MVSIIFLICCNVHIAKLCYHTTPEIYMTNIKLTYSIVLNSAEFYTLQNHRIAFLNPLAAVGR